MKLLTWLRRSLTPFALAALLASNILTLTSTAFNASMSGLLSTAFGMSTVADIMNNRLASKNTKIASQKTAMKTQRKAAQRFGRRLTTRTSKLVATSIAELPAEAIPMLGIPVLIAATAYEIKLACDTLDDLDTLYSSLSLESDVDNSLMQNVCNPSLPNVEELKEAAADYMTG